MEKFALAILLDNSESMGFQLQDGSIRRQVAIDRLSENLRNLQREGTLFSFSLFGNNQSTIPVLPFGHHSLEVARAKIASIPGPQGNTPLAQAILASMDQLDRIAAETKAILCLSDGEHNVIPPTMEQVLEAAQRRGIQVAIGIKVFVVGIGEYSAANKKLYNDIAKSTGGAFVVAGGARTPIDAQAVSKAIDVGFDLVSPLPSEASRVAVQISDLSISLEHAVESQERFRKRANLLFVLGAAFAIATAILLASISSKWQSSYDGMARGTESLMEELRDLRTLWGGQ